MPFTLAHTAVVFPIYKRFKKYFSISGLLMGSMAPDFEFFVRITLYGKWGHTYWGIFLFDLPLSIVVLFIFHNIVRNPLINHLPSWLYARFVPYITFEWNNYFLINFIKVNLSILVGIITHFIWDNFTHEPNYVSPFYFDFLLITLHLGIFNLKLYSLLQVLSSVFGMAFFLWVILQLPFVKDKQTIQKKQIKIYWIGVIGIDILAILLRYFIGVPSEKPMGQFIVISISTFFISLTIVSFFFMQIKRQV